MCICHIIYYNMQHNTIQDNTVQKEEVCKRIRELESHKRPLRVLHKDSKHSLITLYTSATRCFKPEDVEAQTEGTIGVSVNEHIGARPGCRCDMRPPGWASHKGNISTSEMYSTIV